MYIKIIVANSIVLALSGCSVKSIEKSDTEDTESLKDNPSDTEMPAAFKQSGIVMPGDDVNASSLDEEAVDYAITYALELEGSRAPFEKFHSEVAPLLPVTQQSSFQLIPILNCQTVDLDGNLDDACNDSEITEVTEPEAPKDPECPKVCATACASATATASAAAFAHAAVQTCAFAEAWACVFSKVPPFGKVCTWARSEACASAFATAFAFGFATTTDQECKTVCSDGTTIVTKGPADAVQ